MSIWLTQYICILLFSHHKTMTSKCIHGLFIFYCIYIVDLSFIYIHLDTFIRWWKWWHHFEDVIYNLFAIFLFYFRTDEYKFKFHRSIQLQKKKTLYLVHLVKSDNNFENWFKYCLRHFVSSFNGNVIVSALNIWFHILVGCIQARRYFFRNVKISFESSKSF